MKMDNCPFCSIEASVLKNDLAYARFDRNPVTDGHLLILPARHVPSYFDIFGAPWRSKAYKWLIY
jgi:diadenosine tetraphosphate (Ap4A) HIT family hydrolase